MNLSWRSVHNVIMKGIDVVQAARLVIDSADIIRGGEVFITKMPVIKIADLARVMIKELAPVYGYDSDKIKLKIIGSKPGEKLYEELMSQEETRRTVELETPMTHGQIRDFLISNNLMDMDQFSQDHPDQRYWPGDKQEK